MRPILIVEDNDNDLELLLVAMETVRLDNPVLTFRDGTEVLDYLRKEGAYADRADVVPEFILLDLKMPRLNGFDVLRALRDTPAWQHIPVIALTASAEHRDVLRAYDLGARGYVVKPVDFSALIDAVKAIGGMWGHRNELPPDFRIIT